MPFICVPTMSNELLHRRFPHRRAELKRQILATALECFNRQGIEATTIEQIREGCGASVGALYHHFGNKEGVVAALFFAALEDQAELRERYLAKASCAREGVQALIGSYADWVDANPELARFQYQARYAVATGAAAAALDERNRARNRALRQWFAEPAQAGVFADFSAELLPSLIIGPVESYCRAWLAGRVRARPSAQREALAEAAWRSLGGH